jgi:putative hydrolase of the HAD superfamily
MIIKADSSSFLVFDLDDTLYHEINFLISAYKEIANTIDPIDSHTIFHKMFEMYSNGENAFEYLINTFPEKELTIDNLLYLYRNHYPVISAMDGVKEMFDQIIRKKARIGIITNGRSITQRNKLKALGLFPYLSEIIISEECGYEKPDERIYRIISDKYPNLNYFYFGDNVRIDFLAPKKLSWTCVGLKDNKSNIHSDSEKYSDNAFQPHVYITSFKEIVIQ